MPARPREVLATARRPATATEPNAVGARPARPLSASRPRLPAFVLLAIMLWSGAVMLADQPAETLPGFKPNNLFEARGVDTINIFSGDLGIPIALGPEYPLAPGFSWQLKAYYSAKFWKLDASCGDPTDPNLANINHAYVQGYSTLGAGWTLELGYVHGGVDVASDGGSVNYAYHSPDGGRHGFATAANSRSLDGSNLRLSTLAGGTGYQVEFPDGIVQKFTHKYFRPKNANSKDFNDVDWNTVVGYAGAQETPRWGLTSVSNRYNQTLLTVQYVTNVETDPAAFEVDFITIMPVGGIGKTIDYSWTTNTIGSVTWPVLSSVTLPAANGANLSVTFGFLSQAGFKRNGYDNSVGSGAPCTAVGMGITVQAPLLSSVQIGGASGVTYTFSYDTAAGSSFGGSMLQMNLPTGGHVAYEYGPTANGVACIMPCPDMETNDTAPGPAIAALGGGQNRMKKFRDYSPSVITRTESGPGMVTSATRYLRDEQYPQQTSTSPFLDFQISRRVIVTSPDGNGSNVATKYLFHVSTGQENFDNGLELVRRHYATADASAAGTTLRSVVSCWAALGGTPVCGYRDVNGAILSYNLRDSVQRQAEYTWFGVHPAGGNVCPSGSVPCSASESSTWVDGALRYKTVTTRAAGSPTRTVTTDWTPQSTPWLMNLYTRQKSNEGSSENDRYFYFDTATGFLKGTAIGDQALWDTRPSRKTMLFSTCNYPAASDGRVAYLVTARFINPAQLPPSPPACDVFSTVQSWTTIGASQDLFAKHFTYGSGPLPTSTRWLINNGPNDASWPIFSAVREGVTGAVTSSTDSSGLTTVYGYDGLGRLTTVTPPPGEAATVITYDLPTQTTVTRNGGAGLATWQQYLYDGIGRLTREIRQMPGANAYSVRTHAFDAAGHESFASEWGGCTNVATTGDCLSAAPRGTTTSNFDPFGRPRVVIRADGSRTDVAYQDGATSQKTVTASNINGTCTTTCSGGTSASTVSTSDAYGRLISVTEPGGDLTTYTYDVADHLTGVTQGSQTRKFAYDSAGNLRVEQTPEKISATNLKGTVNYDDYGSLGNLIQKIESDATLDAAGTASGGTAVTATYDYAGRLLTQTAGGTRYVMNCYDGIGLCPDGTTNTGGGANPKGKLTRRVGVNTGSAAVVTDDFVYSGLGGRLSTLSTTVSGATQSIDQLGKVDQTWVYNGLGLVALHGHARPSGSTSPFTESIIYAAGLPASIYANGLPAVSGITYAPSGAVNAYTTGLFISTGRTVTTTVTPSTAGLPRPDQIKTTGSVIQTIGIYAYDGVGNIKSIAGAPGSDSFSYDDRSRLTLASLATVGSQTYSYDRFGNLLAKGSGSFCSGTCTNNHLPSPYTYDKRGNLLSTSTESYSYDFLDRTYQASTGWKYGYDAAGERVVRIAPSGAVTWNYSFRDGSNRVSTEFLGAFPSIDNIYLGSQLVLSYGASAGANERSWAFYAADHLGTPRLLTDVSGSLFDTRRYWPFGERIASGTNTQRVRFAAMEADAELGSPSDRYYDHARHHGAGLGRFLSADLMGGVSSRPPSWNRYVYALDNPLKYIDPLGLSECTSGATREGEMTCFGVASSSAADPGDPNRGVRGLFDLVQFGASLFGGFDPAPGPGRTRDSRENERSAVRSSEAKDPLELDAFEDWDMPYLEEAAGFSAGFGDTLSFGLTSFARPSNTVDSGSTSYRVGAGAGTAWWIAVARQGVSSKTGFLNRNRYFRIGFGRYGGYRVFRLSGQVVEKLFKRAHIDLWKGPRL